MRQADTSYLYKKGGKEDITDWRPNLLLNYDKKYIKSLQHFGYGPEIIQKRKTVYQNIETQVKVNGHLSQVFLVKRRLRQGCPLFMILYIIFAETPLENVRQNSDIKGIVIGKKELKSSAFANDTTIYIGNNSSLAHLETWLMHFEKATDIKYNKTERMGIWLGFNKDNPRKPLEVKSNSDTIKILDYTYGYNIILHFIKKRLNTITY